MSETIELPDGIKVQRVLIQWAVRQGDVTLHGPFEDGALGGNAEMTARSYQREAHEIWAKSEVQTVREGRGVRLVSSSLQPPRLVRRSIVVTAWKDIS